LFAASFLLAFSFSQITENWIRIVTSLAKRYKYLTLSRSQMIRRTTPSRLFVRAAIGRLLKRLFSCQAAEFYADSNLNSFFVYYLFYDSQLLVPLQFRREL